MNLTRTTITAGLAALTLAAAAGPALAKGGGDINNTVVSGGTTTTVAPLPAPDNGWDLCGDYFATQVLADGSTLFSNITTGGCLVARISPTGSLSIYKVFVQTGWTYSIKSSDPNKLFVEIPDPFTGDTHSILVEPGRTKTR